MSCIAQLEVAQAVAGIDCFAGEDGSCMFFDQHLIDVGEGTGMEFPYAGSSFHFQTDFVRFIIGSGELEHAAVGTEHSVRTVDFESEVGKGTRILMKVNL